MFTRTLFHLTSTVAKWAAELNNPGRAFEDAP